MENNQKLSRADWLRDPATASPFNRPAWTHSEADIAYMEEMAKIEAQKIAKASAAKGTDKINTDEFQRLVQQELYKLTPKQQSSSFGGGDDLFQHRSLDDEENDFDRRVAEVTPATDVDVEFGRFDLGW